MVAATSEVNGMGEDGAGAWLSGGPGAGGFAAGRGVSSEADSGVVGAHGGMSGPCELGGVPGG
jgi:hypothetical protein